MSLPLAGKRILITRAAHQAGRLAEVLQSLGAELLRIPTIAIVAPDTYAPLDAALSSIAGFNWLIVTSANAVAVIAERMRLLGITADDFRHLNTAVVGAATAAAVRNLGLAVSAMPEEYVAESLVALLGDKLAGQRVLLARAAVARDVIPDALRTCGAEVHVVEAYRTIIPADSIEQLRLLLNQDQPLPDAVTFTSSSTVTNFLALLAAADIHLPARLQAVSIGPVTSATLRSHAWEPASQAETYDIPGLAAACLKLLTPRPLRTGGQKSGAPCSRSQRTWVLFNARSPSNALIFLVRQPSNPPQQLQTRSRVPHVRAPSVHGFSLTGEALSNALISLLHELTFFLASTRNYRSASKPL